MVVERIHVEVLQHSRIASFSIAHLPRLVIVLSPLFPLPDFPPPRIWILFKCFFTGLNAVQVILDLAWYFLVFFLFDTPLRTFYCAFLLIYRINSRCSIRAGVFHWKPVAPASASPSSTTTPFYDCVCSRVHMRKSGRIRSKIRDRSIGERGRIDAANNIFLRRIFL